MELIRQNRNNSCLLCAAAMILDTTPDDIQAFIGHTGNEIKYPEASNQRRGIHTQEILDYAYARGYGFVLIEAAPLIGPETGEDQQAIRVYDEETEDTRFADYIDGRRSIIIVSGSKGGEILHACAWDGEKVYDPNTGVRNIDDFAISYALVLVRF